MLYCFLGGFCTSSETGSSPNRSTRIPSQAKFLACGWAAIPRGAASSSPFGSRFRQTSFGQVLRVLLFWHVELRFCDFLLQNLCKENFHNPLEDSG